MGIRRSGINEAARHALRQLDDALRELRDARLAAGLSQAAVATRLGCSRQLVAAWEARRIEPTSTQLARWAAVVGLEVSLRTFPTGSPLRDAGHLRLLRRFTTSIGNAWQLRTESPVTAEPSDRRTFDVLLSRPPHRVAVEAITRLTDVQAQVRAATLKQEAAGIDCVVLLLGDTRHNRLALREGAPTLSPAFGLDSRRVLRDLRAGRLPARNGIVVV